MQKDQNTNQVTRPKQRPSRADPIRSSKEVRSIIPLLKDNPRDRLLFVMGVNSWVPIENLLELKVKDVRHLKKGDIYDFATSDSTKPIYLEINKPIYDELRAYLKHSKTNDEDYLFASRKGRKPLVKATVRRLIQKWTEKAGLQGEYGCQSLCKTFGYIQRMEYGVGFDVLSERYNHSQPSHTARFLGIPKNQPVSIIKNKVG